MKKTIAFSFIFLLLGLAASAQKMRLAVAANAQYVAQQLADEFKKQTGISTELIVSSSGKLFAQIEQGAPFDVFMSADMKYPLELEAKKLLLEKPKIYAYGQLVLWVPDGKASPAALKDLLLSDYTKIAVANPQLAPYGQATVEALKKQQLLTALQSKIVYGESIAQVNQYLLTGAVQAAFTAKAIVLSPEQKGKGRWIDVDDSLYSPIAQGAVLLKSSRVNNYEDGRKFYAFLFSPSAKKILAAYGYK
ncbi:molybdate ABC transporter substrate-binding protein [Mucilaginibacter ginkgonis]|uniref:Molybdate ABC transporter substrate-binding protein n=1 Tax=Mucilaginibacter ginkgonis TaxID=2682091 RepID=A0A7T7JHN9_9SPHI|nr:molybdate ABC transporter substrate-binding protein [Mucilaginibacter ginkgonis]QQL50740.1 molybdate ABC transporter substrate-binding protein [Mucilaginibacter ginkgonis]